MAESNYEDCGSSTVNSLIYPVDLFHFPLTE